VDISNTDAASYVTLIIVHTYRCDGNLADKCVYHTAHISSYIQCKKQFFIASNF